MSGDQQSDPWIDLIREIEIVCHGINRDLTEKSVRPIPFDLDGTRLLVIMLREAKSPLPRYEVQDDGCIRLIWARMDGHAHITALPGQRLLLDMVMEHRSILQADMPWRNEASVDAVLRSFMALLSHFTPLKQVIVIRRDLKMRQGKSVSQGAHASGEFMKEQLLAVLEGHSVTLSSDEIEWMTLGMAKITVKADTFEQFEAIADRAISKGLKVRTITDSGRTEFHGVPTVTAMAIGPTRSAYVDPITGELTLL